MVRSSEFLTSIQLKSPKCLRTYSGRNWSFYDTGNTLPPWNTSKMNSSKICCSDSCVNFDLPSARFGQFRESWSSRDAGTKTCARVGEKATRAAKMNQRASASGGMMMEQDPHERHRQMSSVYPLKGEKREVGCAIDGGIRIWPVYMYRERIWGRKIYYLMLRIFFVLRDDPPTFYYVT